MEKEHGYEAINWIGTAWNHARDTKGKAWKIIMDKKG